MLSTSSANAAGGRDFPALTMFPRLKIMVVPVTGSLCVRKNGGGVVKHDSLVIVMGMMRTRVCHLLSSLYEVALEFRVGNRRQFYQTTMHPDLVADFGGMVQSCSCHQSACQRERTHVLGASLCHNCVTKRNRGDVTELGRDNQLVNPLQTMKRRQVFSNVIRACTSRHANQEPHCPGMTTPPPPPQQQ